MNPYVLLAGLLLWLASVGAAYYKGVVHAKNAARAEYSRQLESRIAEANENALIDMQAAREVGQREARARVITQTITNEVIKVIHERPSDPVCRWDDRSFGLLNDAISAANARAPASGPVPSGSPAAKPAR